MADAEVDFLLENIQQLHLHHAHLISAVKNEVEKLENDLQLFKTFLRGSTKMRRRDDSMSELGRQIRDLVYVVGDIVDALVSQAADSKSMDYFLRADQTPIKLLSIVKDVESVASRVRDVNISQKGMFEYIARLNVADGDPEENEALRVRKVNMVGFKDEAEKLIGYLKEVTQQLDVISIIGMPGLGKTTLAQMIFQDPDISYEFPTRIWVYISQEFTKKDVFLAILSELTKLTEDIYRKTDQELAQLVAAYLQNGNFLIVLDDVWTARDWHDKLKIAFPEKIKMGKVLITSRNREVGVCANRNRPPNMLRFLTPDEGWELLQWEVFGEAESPAGLEGLGRVIVKKCGMQPLAIVVIGGLLVKKSSVTDGTSAMIKAWTKVSERVSEYIEDPNRSMEKVIALSYDKLPHHLKACFLYLGMFPEDFEIPVWKLTRMWIAEGFIQNKVGRSLEETAENYLDDLIGRNLVRIGKTRQDGKVKTCRIHDILREFCRSEGGNPRENFFQEMRRSGDGTFYPPVAEIQKQRRLCIHSNVLNFVSSKPYGPLVRSFVCFSNIKINLPTENISTIPAAFKMLRVLEVKPIKFTKIPRDMYQLVHLRYITISFDLSILPKAFSMLWNIQTLIVETTSHTLEIKADIWKMIRLRHLKTNAAATLPEIENNSKEGEKLQTLGKISPQCCTEEVFCRASNMKELGVRGDLAMLMDAKNGSFASFEKLTSLEKLKLLNDEFLSPPIGLPPSYQFPPKLSSLTLSGTLLDWSHMSILGLLENLKVLKLKDKAFTGYVWDMVDGGFGRLEVLQIVRTDLVIWKASGYRFPSLRTLQLRYCEKLQEVPVRLADIPTFQNLELYRSKFAASSAKKIRMRKHEMIQEGILPRINVFKLSIFPPSE